jgi:hypothetical protein
LIHKLKIVGGFEIIEKENTNSPKENNIGMSI